MKYLTELVSMSTMTYSKISDCCEQHIFLDNSFDSILHQLINSAANLDTF